jgi:hypothetical protein
MEGRFKRSGDHQAKIGAADERFASAIRLKSDFGHQIGDEYKKTGDFEKRHKSVIPQ